jgi:membrane protease subunit (stomatin/prohibitin family)
MVHGEFSFKVVNCEQLLVGLVGTGRTGGDQVPEWMKEQVLKVLRDRISQLCVKNKWPLLDVTSGAYTEELETEALAGLDQHVASYGLKIVRLGNFVIAIREEDAANLKKLYTDAAYLRTVGGVGAYQQFAAGKALMGAGEGMAKGGGGEGGGGMLGGASLGVGLGMAQAMINQQNQQRAGQPAATGAGFCVQCGTGLSAGAKFCAQCGTKVPGS